MREQTANNNGLVAHEDNGDVVANPHEVTVPVRHILVRNAGGHVKHDDRALPLDIVAIAEPAKLFLACSVPAVEFDPPDRRREHDRVDLDAKRGHVLLLELARQVALDKLGEMKGARYDRCA